MSTYVPGVETYLPDIKPFTPDYKFLSSVLQSRQDKYNRNWQATNDLYSKIVYAPLSREDNLDKREQYIEQIKPSIEKISGLDLSIQQNVDSAKAVFAPFYEDDLLVKDMLYTTNYQNEMAYANRLVSSPDKEQSSKWWETGIKDLQYKMQDFQNASGDAALAMGLPRYVNNINLYDMAEKYLSELDPPLKLTKRFNDPNADYIITQTNGDLVTGQYLEMLKNKFIDDPAVQRAYYTQAFVQGRDFADKGIKTGEFSSIQQGQEAWAQQTIDLITKQNNFLMQKTTKALQREAKGVSNWEIYRKNNGIIPGSQDEKIMKEQYDSYLGTKAALQSMQDIKGVSKTPIRDYNDTLQKAYQLTLMNSIGTDLIKAASDFSMRDYNLDYEINEIKRDRVKHQRAKELAMFKSSLSRQNAIDLAIMKGEIPDPEKQRLIDAVEKTSTKLGSPYQISSIKDEDGKFVIDKSSVNDNVYLEDYNLLLEEKIKTITSAKEYFSDYQGDNNTGSYTITLDNGETLKGSIQTIKNALASKDKTGNYININAIEKEFQNIKDITESKSNEASRASKLYPTKVEEEKYRNLYNNIWGVNSITNREDALYTEFTLANENMFKVNQKYKEAVKLEGKGNIYAAIQANFPDLINKGGKLSEEEYKNEAVKRAANKELKNYRNGEEYKTVARKTEYINYVPSEDNPNLILTVYSDSPLPNANRSQEIKSVLYTDKTGKMVPARERFEKLDRSTMRLAEMIDENTIKRDAGKVYNMLNKGFINSPLYEEVITLPSARQGVSGDTEINPIYTTSVNPAGMSKDATKEATSFLNQVDMLNRNGLSYGVVLGDVENKDDYLTKNSLAVDALDLLIEQFGLYITNPKKYKGITPSFNIEYSTDYGSIDDLTKSKAAIKIKPNSVWLNSYQKGGENFETGVFKKGQINQLEDGITLIFDQQNDINVRQGLKQYYSPLMSEIELSPNNFVSKQYPGNDSIPTAELKISKSANELYYATYRFNTYNEKTSQYDQSQFFTKEIRGDGRALDRGIQKMNEGFERVRIENKQRKAIDQKLNGQK